MQSLMHACIFRTSKPKGRQPSLLRTYWRATRYSSGTYSSTFSANFQMMSHLHLPVPSILANPVCSPAFSDYYRILDTTTFCDPLTCDPNSPSPCQFRSVSVHQQWSDQDHQRAHHVPLLHLHLTLPHLQHHPP